MRNKKRTLTDAELELITDSGAFGLAAEFGGTFLPDSHGCNGSLATAEYSAEAVEDEERVNRNDKLHNGFVPVEEVVDPRTEESRTEQPIPVLLLGTTLEDAVEAYLWYSPANAIKLFEMARQKNRMDVLLALSSAIAHLAAAGIYAAASFTETRWKNSCSCLRVLTQYAKTERLVDERGGIACRMLAALMGTAN